KGVPARLHTFRQHTVDSLEFISNLPKSNFQILVKIRCIADYHLNFQDKLAHAPISKSCHCSDCKDHDKSRSKLFLDLQPSLEPSGKRICQKGNKPSNHKWHKICQCLDADHKE